MKILKRLLALVLSATIIITGFVVPTTAASTAIVWNGTSTMKSGKTYIINKSITVRKNFTIPANTKLSVQKTGALLVAKGVNVTVKGRLSIRLNATSTMSGNIKITSTGVLDIYGTLKTSISATIKNSGAINVYNCGEFRTSSKMTFYKNSTFYNKGYFILLKSGTVTSSAKMTCIKGSETHFQGNATFTLSSTVSMAGYMSIGKNSTVRCSGKITLAKTAGYTRFGKLNLTKSGVLTDKRPASNSSEFDISMITDSADKSLKGIDVSYAQGDINWSKVASSGVDFAMIRAGRGVAGTKPMKEDDYFAKNIKGATANGIDVGVYFYSYATTVAQAEAEAEFLIGIIQEYNIQYPIVLDVEEEEQRLLGVKKLTKIVDAFLSKVEEAGYLPMLYSCKSWLQYSFDMTVLDEYPVWLAQINPTPTYDGAFYMWQYSWTGNVSGISGEVDMNISYRDFSAITSKYKLNNLS